MGQDASAAVVLEGRSEQRVRLYANVGEISQPMEEIKGRIEAIYTPPGKKYPQVAIIAAVSDDGGSFTWTAIPLFGSASVKIETKPYAEVKLRVAATDYGPATTDKQGIVSMNVLVPPGVAEATSFVTDRLGNASTSSVKLGAPAFNRVLAVCPPAGHRFLLFAVDEKGGPLRVAEFDLKAFPVTTGEVTPLADGVFAASIGVPDGVDAGEKATLIASLPGDPASAFSCTMGVPLERPNRIKVHLSPAVFVAGSGKPVAVIVDLQYPGKRKPGRVPVALSATLGTISEPSAEGDTGYRAVWTLPDTFAGNSTASIKARTTSDRRLTSEASLQLRAGPAARLKVIKPDTRLIADGKTKARISAEVRDGYDNRVLSDVHLIGEAKLGSLAPFETLADGNLAAVYTAPNRYEAGDDRLVVRLAGGENRKGLSDTCRVGLNPRKRTWSASLRLGYISNLGRVYSPLFMAAMGIRLPFADQNLAVGVETGYYGNNTVRTGGDRNENVITSVTAYPLLARVLYQFTFGPVRVCPGLGAGALFTSLEVKSPDTGDSRIKNPYFLFAGFAGASLPAGAGRALIELGYWHSRVDEPWVNGSLGGLHGTAGYELEF